MVSKAVAKVADKSVTTFDLREKPKLASQLEHSKAALKWWAEEVARLQREIVDLAGDADLILLEGEPVFTHERINSIRGEALKKDHPDIYQAYLKTVEKEEFDLKLFKLARPDLFKQYATRPLKSVS